MKQIKVAVEGAKTIPYSKLLPFQNDLKILTDEQYKKLKESILSQGFSFSVHVWQNKGKNYIIDGHQRIETLKRMSKEGFNIPPVPVSMVSAKSYSEAKKKVLSGASQYGSVSEQGLLDFINENNIDFSEIDTYFSFPELDLERMMKDVAKEMSDGSIEIDESDVSSTLVHKCPKCGFSFSSPK